MFLWTSSQAFVRLIALAVSYGTTKFNSMKIEKQEIKSMYVLIWQIKHFLSEICHSDMNTRPNA